MIIMSDHIELVNGCMTCLRRFATTAELMRHVRVVHERANYCPLCHDYVSEYHDRSHSTTRPPQ